METTHTDCDKGISPAHAMGPAPSRHSGLPRGETCATHPRLSSARPLAISRRYWCVDFVESHFDWRHDLPSAAWRRGNLHSACTLRAQLSSPVSHLRLHPRQDAAIRRRSGWTVLVWATYRLLRPAAAS